MNCEHNKIAEFCQYCHPELGKSSGEEYEPYFGWCDVEGCENEGCSGGNAWRETGHWIVCTQHAGEYRAGKPQPEMKQNAIDRENSRDKTTGYLPKIESSGEAGVIKPCPFCGEAGELRPGELKATLEEAMMAQKNARCSKHGCLARYVVCSLTEWNTRAFYVTQ